MSVKFELGGLFYRGMLSIARSFTGFPSCRPPGPVMFFELTSQILIATVMDSDPEFIQINFVEWAIFSGMS